MQNIGGSSESTLDERGQLVKAVWLLNARVKVSGRTTQKFKRRDESTDGLDREREYDVEERIENEAQYNAAKKIETQLRGLADKNAVYVDGFGHLASPAAKERFVADFAAMVANEVAHHNAIPGQTAIIDAKIVTLQLGMTFGTGEVTSILEHVSGELQGALDALKVGNTDAVTSWLKRSQRLSGLFPSLNESVVASALASLRDTKNAIAKAARDTMGAEAFRNALGQPLPDEVLKTVLNTVQFDACVEQVEAALGWLAPGDKRTLANAVGSVG